jgi:uncharacterized membrane protein YuzA (DUF378 family)
LRLAVALDLWTTPRTHVGQIERPTTQAHERIDGRLLILTVFGALNAVWSGLGGPDLIHMAMGPARTVGTDFLRILTGLAAMATLVWGLRAIRAGK